MPDYSTYIDGAGVPRQSVGVFGVETDTYLDGAGIPRQSVGVFLTDKTILLPESFPALGLSAVERDTSQWQAAIDFAASVGGGYIKASRGSYQISHLNVTSPGVTLDFNGASIIASPASSSASDHSGAPMIYARGSAGPARPIATATQDSKTVVAAGFGGGFAIGDIVVIQDAHSVNSWNFGQPGASVGPGISYRAEVNTVTGVSGDTLTLSMPLMFGYDTSPTISKVTPLTGLKVMNIGKLTEVDPGGAYTGDFGTMANTPYIVGVEYADEPQVENVYAENWQLQLANFKFCRNPRGTAINGKRPIRPATGGHGYINRADRSLGAFFTRCHGDGVRHIVDCVQSRNTTSAFNKGYSSVASSFAAHGHFSRGFSSVKDEDYGSNAGWAIGNGSFAGDYESSIIDPKAVGSEIAVLVACLSEDIELVNPNFQRCRRGVFGVAGVKRFTVRGGRMTPMATTPSLIFFRSKQADADAYAFPCEDIRVLGGVYETRGGPAGQAPILIGANGLIEVSDALFKFDDPCFAGVYLTSQDGVALTPTEIIMERNRGWGTGTGRFVSQTMVPSSQLVFSENIGYGASRNNYIAPLESARMTMRGNNNGQGGWVFNTPIQDAITAGATVVFNYPDISGGWFNRIKQLMSDTFSTRGLSVASLAGENADITLGAYTDAAASPQFNVSSPRWIFRRTNTAESGANAGSDLQLLRRADNGASLGVPLTVTRSTGEVSMTDGKVSIAGTYQKPLVLSGTRIWQNASTLQLYYKSGSDPSNDADGNLIVRFVAPPASATASGSPGSVAWNATHAFFCVASNTWRRVPHDTW